MKKYFWYLLVITFYSCNTQKTDNVNVEHSKIVKNESEYSEGLTVNGKKEGPWINFSDNETIRIDEYKRDTLFKELYIHNGKIIEIAEYVNGKIVKSKIVDYWAYLEKKHLDQTFYLSDTAVADRGREIIYFHCKNCHVIKTGGDLLQFTNSDLNSLNSKLSSIKREFSKTDSLSGYPIDTLHHYIFMHLSKNDIASILEFVRTNRSVGEFK